MLLVTLDESSLGYLLTGKAVIVTTQGRGIYRAGKGKGKGINRAAEGVLRPGYVIRSSKIDF